jgi:hypothetical protein
MTTEDETPVPELDRETWLVCGDCAAKIIQAGGEHNKAVRQVDYGQLCEAHAGLPTQATSAILVPKDYMHHVERTSEPVVLETRDVGPKTRIAVDLLVAWTTSAAKADDRTVKHAVDVAENILNLTKGE